MFASEKLQFVVNDPTFDVSPSPKTTGAMVLPIVQTFGTVLSSVTVAEPAAIAIPVVASIAAPARRILRIDFLQSSKGFRHV
jgi:hypothetical protein